MTVGGRVPVSLLRRAQHDTAVAAAAAGLIHAERGQLRLARCISEIAVATDVIDRLLPSGLVVVLTSSQELVDHVAVQWNRARPDAAYLLTGYRHRAGGLPSDVLLTTSSDIIAIWAAACTHGQRVLVGQHRHADYIGEGLLKAGCWADILVVHEAHHTAGRTKPHAAVHNNKRLPAAARLYTTAVPQTICRPAGSPAGPDEVALGTDDDVFGPVLHEYLPEQAITDGTAARFRLHVTATAAETAARQVFCTHRRSDRTVAVTLAEALTPEVVPSSPLVDEDSSGCAGSTGPVTVTLSRAEAPNPETVVTITVSNTSALAPAGSGWAEALQTYRGVEDVLRALRDWDPAFGRALDAVRAHGSPYHQDLLRWVSIESPTAESIDGVGNVLAALAKVGSHDWWVGYGHLAAYVARVGNAVVPKEYAVGGYPLGEWLAATRTRYARHGLPLDRHNAMRALGDMRETQRDLNRRHRRDQHIATAEMFHRQYGHLDLGRPGTDAPESFRRWAAAVRSGVVHLTDNERAALDALGMQWDPPSLQRRRAITAAFADYHARHGNLDFPDDLMVDVLGRPTRMTSWVATFRKDHRLGTLHPDLRQVLDDMGFIFDPDAHWWQDVLATARRYYELHGNLAAAPNAFHTAAGQCLFTALKKCRSRSRQRLFDVEHAAILAALDPFWGLARRVPIQRPQPRPLQSERWARDWDDAFAAVERFYKQFGHIEVPRDLRAEPAEDGRGVLLRPWLHQQRRRHNMGTIPERQKRKLESIGYLWDLHEAEWLTKYELASEFYRQHRHLIVTRAHVRETPKFARLPAWIWKQATLRAAQQLSDERIALLDRIGMPWVAKAGRERQWEQRLQEVNAFRHTYGHLRLRVRASQTNDAEEAIALQKLATWLSDQLSRAKRGALRANRREQMLAIGISLPASDPARNAARSRN